METHVKVLAVVYIVSSALGTLAAFMVAALPVIGLTGVARSAFLLIVSLAGLVTAIGLLKHLRWARLLAIALSALTLINMPFGFLVGVYGLAVLLSKEGARLFSALPPAAA